MQSSRLVFPKMLPNRQQFGVDHFIMAFDLEKDVTSNELLQRPPKSIVYNSDCNSRKLFSA